MAAELPGDPTRPAQHKAKSQMRPAIKHNYVLSYLVVGDARRIAVVNGKQVTAGSRVDGARVLEITTEGVRLRIGNRSKTLFIGKQTGLKKENTDRKWN